MTYLGVDLGTSALKAILVDDDQSLLAQAVVPLHTVAPRPGWSEQDPRDWWAAFKKAMEQLHAARPEAVASVHAIGLSGQMHGAVLVDRAGEPLRPAILWNDGRATAECAALAAAVPNLPFIAGVLPMPGFTAPKLLWLARHEPERMPRLAKVLSPKDYLRLKLTGEAVTDVSDAGGTLWLDQAGRRWSQPIVTASGLDGSHMPGLVESNAPGGEASGEILRDYGIPGPVLMAGGAGDAAGAAIGIGAVEPGDAFVSLGTSAQLFVTDERYCPQPDTLLHAFAHALPQRWYRMAAMLNGAVCLDWVARLLREEDIPALLVRTEQAFRGPSRVLFLPYLSGERTPHNDPAARGVFFGLDPQVGPTDLVQATLEGVAFSLLDARRRLETAGLRLSAVAAVGGGARSRFWMQLVAHVLGRPVVRYRGSETGPAFGAARLARMALTGAAPGAVCRKPPILDVLEPDPALHAAYAERFERFASLYRALKEEFRQAVDFGASFG